MSSKSLRELNFDNMDNSELDNILKEDANSKYFHAVAEQPLDATTRHASRKKR